MIERNVADNYSYDPETKRVAEKRTRNNDYKVTIGHCVLAKYEDIKAVQPISWPELFRRAERPDLPSLGNAPEIFRSFPGDSDQCLEDYQVLQDPETDPDVLFDITQRAVWSIQRRHEYVDALTGINREVYEHAVEKSKDKYYMASSRATEKGRLGWEQLRSNLDKTISEATKNLDSEVKDAADTIRNVTLALANLKESFQGASGQIDIIRRGSELENMLSRLISQRAQITENNPDTGESTPKLSKEGISLLNKTIPELQGINDPELKGELISKYMDKLNSNIEEFKDKAMRLAPQVELAKVGANTNFRTIKGNLERLLVAVDSVDSEGEDVKKLIDKMRQKAKRALDSLVVEEVGNGQPKYSSWHVELAKEAVDQAEQLAPILASDIRSNVKGKGAEVLMAILEADRAGREVIEKQLAATAHASDQYRVDVLEQAEFNNDTSKYLTDLRASLSLIQREAIQKLTDAETTKQAAELREEQLKEVMDLRQELEGHSEEVDAGYKDFFEKTFWPVTLKKFRDERRHLDVIEDANDRLVEVPVMNMTAEAWQKATTTLESKKQIADNMVEFYNQKLAEAQAVHGEKLEESREFLIENITTGFEDVRYAIAVIDQHREIVATSGEYDLKETKDKVSDEADSDDDAEESKKQPEPGTQAGQTEQTAAENESTYIHNTSVRDFVSQL